MAEIRVHNTHDDVLLGALDGFHRLFGTSFELVRPARLLESRHVHEFPEELDRITNIDADVLHHLARREAKLVGGVRAKDSADTNGTRMMSSVTHTYIEVSRKSMIARVGDDHRLATSGSSKR